MTVSVERHLVAPSLALCIVAVAVAWIVGRTVDLATGDILYYFYNVHDTPAALAFFAVLAGVLFLFRRLPLDTVLATLRQAARWRYPLAAAVVAVLAAGTLIVYRNQPLSMDEYVPMFQAKLFSQGRLWAEFPPDMLRWLFHQKFLVLFFQASATTGRVISQYWPGHAVLLTPFVKLGAAWLLNPVLAAGSLLLLVGLARRLLPDTEAPGWVLLLTLASPQFTINAISYYSMSAHLFLNLLFASLLIRPTLGRALLAGVVGSFALVLHQPLPHLLFGLPWFLWLAFHKRSIRHLGALLLGYIPLGLLLGAGWLVLKSHVASHGAVPALPQATAAAPSATAPSGEAQPAASARRVTSSLWERFRGQLSRFSWPDAEILGWRLIGLLKLFLWAVPGLPLLAIIGYRRRREVTGLRVLGWSAMCSVLGYFFVPYSQGHGWGYRYFHQAWGVLPLLAAAALVSFKSSRADWFRVVGMLALASLLLLTPLRAAQVNGFIDRHLAQLPPLAEDEHQICFLASYRGFYVEDLVQNDPFLRDPVLFLDSHGPEMDERLIRRRFPTARRVYDNGFDTVWVLE